MHFKKVHFREFGETIPGLFLFASYFDRERLSAMGLSSSFFQKFLLNIKKTGFEIKLICSILLLSFK